MDLALADVALGSFDREGCLRAAERCVDASRRYGLATLLVAYLWLAGAHALAGDEAQMDQAAALALESDAADPRVLGDLWGRVRATLAIVRDDRVRLRTDLNAMMGHARSTPPGKSFFPNRLLWAMLRTVEDDDHGSPARAELEAARLDWSMMWASVRAMVEAVAEGRRQPSDELTARFADLSQSLLDLESFDGTVHYLHVVAAEAAIRDEWGEPVTWLRRAEAFFHARGYSAIARRCRRLLGEAGAPMPRQGRGDAVVPAELRALGVTSRELDVLLLVADGLSNREIGDRLYLSPKTVKRHLSSLFHRTGLHDRRALAALAHSMEDARGR
jgi:DNA-binding CsgD family transcriptional regulator